ncbi:MAG TPA: type II secretion system protein GspM [Solirubrobacteraceae bacterium]|nr:type II secretion system protein GspM [Solirubrobacteraceae bacterium]
MTRRNTILLVAVAAVAAVGAYWMLVLTPQREEVAALDKQIAAKQATLAAAASEVASYEQARAAYKANYSMVARLGKAVPADDDVRSLLVQINSAADRSGVDFRTISVGGSGAPTTGPAAPGEAPVAAPPPGASSVGSAGFSTMPFTFGFKGDFFELGKFFKGLDRFVAVKSNGLDVTGRLLLLNSFTLSPDAEKGFPMLTADVSASSYLLPPTEGLTAGATPEGPTAGGAPGAPAPEPGAPATTTAAAVTGASR